MQRSLFTHRGAAMLLYPHRRPKVAEAGLAFRALLEEVSLRFRQLELLRKKGKRYPDERRIQAANFQLILLKTKAIAIKA